MHAMHARLPKHFVLEERLERYAAAIEVYPERYRGRWAEACTPFLGARDASSRYRNVWLDMGCGKGSFTAEMARRHPQDLYIGIDSEPICIAYAAQKACEGINTARNNSTEDVSTTNDSKSKIFTERLPNMLLIPALGSALTRIFAPGELAGIYLNFPTPFPKKRNARLRLTYLDQLMIYREVLAPNAPVLFKTDSYPLWRFSLTQFELAGYKLLWQSENARFEHPQDAMSWYEERLSAQGASVYAIEATPGPKPKHPLQTAELSLAEYLPQDLEHLPYIPHGMQGTVINLRNYQRKQSKKL